MTAQLALQWEESASPLTWFEPDEIEIRPGFNPRGHIDPAKVAEIAASIRVNGVLQNVVVNAPENGGRHWLIAGETRVRAAAQAGAKVPARVVRMTEAEALTIALTENLNRNDLTPIEEARGFARLLALDPEMTQARVAETFGLSQSHIGNMLSLLELPEAYQQLIDEGVIAWSLARDTLVPVAKDEAIGDKVLGTALTMIRMQPENARPITRVWLNPLIEKLLITYRTPVPAAKSDTKASKSDTKPTSTAAKAPEKPKVDTAKLEKTLTQHKPDAPSFARALKDAQLELLQKVLRLVKNKAGHKTRAKRIDERVKEIKAEQRKREKAKAAKPAKASVPAAAETIEEQARELGQVDAFETSPGIGVSSATESESESALGPQATGTVADDHGAAASAAGGPETGGEYTCIHCGCKDSEACIGGCSWLAKDEERKLGVCSQCAATVAIAEHELFESHFVDAAGVEAAMAAAQNEEAEPDPEPIVVPGIFGVLMPLLDDCTITIAVSRLAQPATELCAVVTPRPTEGKQQIPPLTITAVPEYLEVQLLEKLPGYINTIIAVPTAEE